MNENTESFGEVILFPDDEKLKEEVEKLRAELSMLVLERDELRLVECKNLEMEYMLALGGLEYKTYKAECQALRLKRKLELIQVKINRQEKPSVMDIEHQLDNEFEKYQEKLNEELNKMNDALERSKGELLSAADTKELKKKYHSIVKLLHPDLHPELSKAELQMFDNAVNAYKNGDLQTIRIIDEMLSGTEKTEDEQDSAVYLAKERERLSNLLQAIKDNIAEIKQRYPYTEKELLSSQEKLDARKADIEDMLHQYEDMIEAYSTKIKEMLRDPIQQKQFLPHLQNLGFKA